SPSLPRSDPCPRVVRPFPPRRPSDLEPGVYFIPALLRTMAPPNRARVDWDAVERLLPYGGIRIEDDVLVEGGGIRNLTREAFAADRKSTRLNSSHGKSSYAGVCLKKK